MGTMICTFCKLTQASELVGYSNIPFNLLREAGLVEGSLSRADMANEATTKKQSLQKATHGLGPLQQLISRLTIHPHIHTKFYVPYVIHSFQSHPLQLSHWRWDIPPLPPAFE